jgi:ABC-type Mn2+/Zn2+ transport system permease subunit/Mn-dependent DtxR family transcriptional regulator/Fe2+ transport system protein FeoA
MEFWEIVQQAWVFRALAASMLVGLSCGVLGCFIVLRNMALIGDALSHAILPGVVVAFVWVGYSVLGFFTGAVVAGLLSAVFITWIQQHVRTKNDAAIGIVFTAMFSLGVIGISWISRNEGVHLDLKDFLFGNVLGVSNQDLYLTLGVTVYVLISVLLLYRYLFITTFQPVVAQTMGISVKAVHYFLMLLLSFAVVAALQTVGVILVVAMLITPAATALLLSDRLPVVLFLAALIGMASALLGMVAAILFETTPGPAMTVMATLLYLLAVFFSPTKGLLFTRLRGFRLRRRIREEDLLKWAYRMEQQGELVPEHLAKHLSISNRLMRSYLLQLAQRGLLERQPLRLTEAGRAEGRRLVRAHRLWETYLVEKLGLSADQIHEEAEEYEHLLTEEILDQVEAELNYPTTDPHGSPIPVKSGLPAHPLWYLTPGQQASISGPQLDEYLSAQLWQLGLLPDEPFYVLSREGDVLRVKQQDRRIDIPHKLANRIVVREK